MFCKPSGEPYDDQDIQQHVIKKAAKRAGIYYEGFGLHRIRSASITQLQAEGHASSIEAQKHAGHGRVSMTADYYTVLGLERHRALVRALQAPLMRRPQVGVRSVSPHDTRFENVAAGLHRFVCTEEMSDAVEEMGRRHESSTQARCRRTN